MSCTTSFDQWANPIQDLGSYLSYDGPEISSHLLCTLRVYEQQGTRNQSFVWPTMSQPWNHLSQLFDAIMLSNRTKQFGPRWQENSSLWISSNSFIKRSIIAGRKAVYGPAEQHQIFVPHGWKAVHGSANQKLPNSFLKSELNIIQLRFPGERRGIPVVQHNTNNTTTGEKPEYMPSGLAFSKELHHRNNIIDRCQAPMNNFGIERGCMDAEIDLRSEERRVGKECRL